MNGIAETGVFITGGCGDIGRAVGKRFLDAGARVVLADILPLTRGRAVARVLDVQNAAYVRCDVTQSASVDLAFTQALKFLGRLDTVICNAGFVANRPFIEMTEKVAGSFLFLASDDGVYLTGTTLLVDGGATLVRRE